MIISSHLELHPTITSYRFFISCTFQNRSYSILIDIFRWQARKEQDRNMRAGLIPSRALQERRIVHERNEKMNTLVDGEGK